MSAQPRATLTDNPAARPSADELLPQFQQTRVGDWVPMSRKVTETTAFNVEALEPNRWLLWAKPHSTWAWTLSPLDGGGTRLVTRLKAMDLDVAAMGDTSPELADCGDGVEVLSYADPVRHVYKKLVVRDGVVTGAILLGAEINAEMEKQTVKDTTTGPDKPLGERDAVKADLRPSDPDPDPQQLDKK